MGSLRQDLAPYISYHESHGQGSNTAQDVDEDDDWGSDDDAMILGTTPHVCTPYTLSFLPSYVSHSNYSHMPGPWFTLAMNSGSSRGSSQDGHGSREAGIDCISCFHV